MILKQLVEKMPGLTHKLRVAHMDVKPEKFLRKVLIKSALWTLMLTLLLAMLTDNQGWNWVILPFAVVIFYSVAVWMGLKSPVIAAYRRGIDIEREVLFAGRFLLIKLHSGKPLVNALIDASKSYGVAGKYFAEIVRDIELGTTLEEAIENAMIYTPSDSFRKILFQIHNALKLGIDVTQSLEAVLEDITKKQLLEVQSYGKKLPTATLFYMLIAIVMPSLGMTILTVLLSFTDITMNMGTYGVVLFFLVLLNFFFITIFRSIRPKVNI